MGDYSIIGRKYEQRILKDICNEREAQLVAIYGRRRVGKTYLIKCFFKEHFDFLFTGTFETTTKVQLKLFHRTLEEYSGNKVSAPKDWFEAFEQLKTYLMSSKKKQLVVFLDELPWMDTPKSNFLAAFSFFWNNWASTMANLKIIICGSSTSWMLDKIIGDKGGLYGRCSRAIYIAPFNLFEVEQFLKLKKNIEWNRYQILEAYMVFGGIPYYLDMLEKGLPFDQNIDNLFYRRGAPLRTEYDFLFRSLFKSSSLYRQIIEILAKKNLGMTLKEIKKELNFGDGGVLSNVLANLCKCDFIRKYCTFGKKNHSSYYQLIDQLCLYHQKFIGRKTGIDEHYWSNIGENTKNAWAGNAFEQLCLHHINQIKSKLGIKGVLTNVYSWSISKHIDEDGTYWPGGQIDLIMSRADNVVDIFEMKYSKSLFTVTGDYEKKIRERSETFKHHSKTKSAIHNILVTTYGLRENIHSSVFNSTVTMDDLFASQEE